MDTNIFAAKVV